VDSVISGKNDDGFPLKWVISLADNLQTNYNCCCYLRG